MLNKRRAESARLSLDRGTKQIRTIERCWIEDEGNDAVAVQNRCRLDGAVVSWGLMSEGVVVEKEIWIRS